MAHYSEMDFLFGIINKDSINQQLSNFDNTSNIFAKTRNNYVVYKSKGNSNLNPSGTENIQTYLREKVYKHENDNTFNNPYIQILNDFNQSTGTPGAGLKIRAADLAYLRDLGVYPMNRMIVLRRFPEGCFVPEDLNEMQLEPISTVIGWIKPDQTFGKIDFNENWTTTDERFDIVLTNILKKMVGMGDGGKSLIPVPDVAQGILFDFYGKLGLLDKSGVDDVNETYEFFDPGKNIDNSKNVDIKGNSTQWGLKNLPIGDPNVLQEGPFRNPESQNIQSSFSFDLVTTYEQKLLGDVDPGSAMLDILDNLYAMGTSNMVFYWGDNSSIMNKAKDAVTDKANNLNYWWELIKNVFEEIWGALKEIFSNALSEIKDAFENAKKTDAAQKNIEIYTKNISVADSKLNSGDLSKEQISYWAGRKEVWKTEKAKLEEQGIVDKNTALKAPMGNAKKFITDVLGSILTSTVGIHRFKLRGSLELMVGGKQSSTPWYLTLGNPYSPWLSTNHIIVKSGSIDTSTEMGFNDQPQTITVTFNCQFSRALGKQELMRMFNNSYRRTYSVPPVSMESKPMSTVPNTSWQATRTGLSNVVYGANSSDAGTIDKYTGTQRSENQPYNKVSKMFNSIGHP